MDSICCVWGKPVLLKFIVASFAIVIIANQSSGLFAQESERNPDFKVAMSQKIGFGGITSTTTFMLIDEFGFRYDTMNILTNDSAKRSLDVSDEQFADMSASWAESKKQIDAIAISAIVSDEKRDKVEELFVASQAAIHSVLDQDQLQRLDMVKAGLAIEDYGIANYLKTKRVRSELGISEAQAESIGKARSKFKAGMSRELSELIRQANMNLVEKLSDKQRQTFKPLLSEEEFNQFLDTKLFTSNKLANADSAATNDSKNRREFFGMCFVRKIREQAGIDEAKYDEIREIRSSAMKMEKSEFESKLKEILTPEQLNILQVAASARQTQKLGTVNSLSHGILASKMGVTEEQAESFFQYGKQLQDEMVLAARKAKKRMMAEAYGSLSNDQVAHLNEIIESSDPLKVPVNAESRGLESFGKIKLNASQK